MLKILFIALLAVCTGMIKFMLSVRRVVDEAA